MPIPRGDKYEAAHSYSLKTLVVHVERAPTLHDQIRIQHRI